MRNTLKLVVALSVMFVSLTSVANSRPSLIASEAKSLIFSLDNQLPNTKIELSDAQGNNIYNDAIANGTYAKKFNLNSLESGTFFLSVNNDLTETVYTINVTASSVAVVEVVEHNKPVFRTENGHVYINFMNKEMETVNVRVVDENDRVVFSEKIKDTLLVEKSFNFEKAHEGNYTVIIEDNSDTYYTGYVVK